MSDPEIAALRAVIAARPRAPDIPTMRLNADQRGRDFGLPADVVVQKVDAGGVPAEWVTAPGCDPMRAVLYLHGGGYVIGSINTHRRLAYDISAASGARHGASATVGGT